MPYVIQPFATAKSVLLSSLQSWYICRSLYRWYGPSLIAKLGHPPECTEEAGGAVSDCGLLNGRRTSQSISVHAPHFPFLTALFLIQICAVRWQGEASSSGYTLRRGGCVTASARARLVVWWYSVYHRGPRRGSRDLCCPGRMLRVQHVPRLLSFLHDSFFNFACFMMRRRNNHSWPMSEFVSDYFTVLEYCDMKCHVIHYCDPQYIIFQHIALRCLR